MRGNSAQWKKEVRQMAWPWAIVMGAGLLVMARPWFASLPDIPGMAGVWVRMVDWILPIGAFFGTAILAVLPLGSEFQYRTLAMHMAQPIDREQIWRQKFLLTVAAVVPPAVLYCIALGGREGRGFGAMAAAWILMTMFGAFPFTILARSIVGGMVLNQLGSFWVMMAWSLYEQHKISAVWLQGVGVLVVVYAICMTWLGRRMILRFQAVDGMQAREDFVPGAQLVPEAVARWFQCRPGQPIANLVRREFRLTRVLWLLIAVYALAWIFMLIFHLLPDQSSGERFIAFAFTAILGVIIAVLAGTLSLGEEKTGGTYDWHLTLPVSPTTQWAVKLLFAEFTSLFWVALVPMLMLVVAGRAGDSPQAFLSREVALGWVLEVAAITLAAFWCACAVKGTVQATLWVFPLGFGIMFSGFSGTWIVEALDRSHGVEYWIARAVAWLDPVTVGRAVGRLLSMIDYRNIMPVVAVPLVGIGLIQTLRMFRSQTSANKLRVVRCALPMMMLAFVWGVLSVVLFEVLYLSWNQQRAIIKETDQAIASMQADGNPGPHQVSVSDLAKAAPLSDGTRRWLRDANLTIASAPELKVNGGGGYLPGRIIFHVRTEDLKNRVPYSAIVRNGRGRDCSLMFQIQHTPEEKYNVGYVTFICE